MEAAFFLFSREFITLHCIVGDHMTYKILWQVRAYNKKKQPISFRISADGWTEENIIKTLSEVHPELESITLEDIHESEETVEGSEDVEEEELKKAS